MLSMYQSLHSAVVIPLLSSWLQPGGACWYATEDEVTHQQMCIQVQSFSDSISLTVRTVVCTDSVELCTDSVELCTDSVECLTESACND